MKITVIKILIVIMVFFILIVSTTEITAKQAELSKNAREKTLINVITPFIIKSWENKRDNGNGEYILQILKQIILIDVKPLEEKEIYYVVIIYQAGRYKETKKIEEAVFSQDIFFLINKELIEEWQPTKPIIQKILDLDTDKLKAYF